MLEETKSTFLTLPLLAQGIVGFINSRGNCFSVIQNIGILLIRERIWSRTAPNRYKLRLIHAGCVLCTGQFERRFCKEERKQQSILVFSHDIGIWTVCKLLVAANALEHERLWKLLYLRFKKNNLEVH